MNNLIRRFYIKIRSMSITPAWLVMAVDMVIVLISVFLAVFLRDNFRFQTTLRSEDWFLAPLTILVSRFLFFLIFKTQRQVVRYTNTTDVSKIFFSCLAGSGFVLVINLAAYILKRNFVAPTSVVIMEFFITTVLIICYRFVFKIYYFESKNPSKGRKNIIILGTGESGIITKRSIERDNATKYNVIAFFDNDPKKIGMQVESLPVHDSRNLRSYLSEHNISFLIIAVQKISNAEIKTITETALPFNVKVLKVPPVSKWLNGTLSFKQIKKVKIEDLLDRDPIQLDLQLLNPEIVGQTILITGAAGSIGSEIVRQLLNFDYKQLVLIDTAETPCFYLQNEVRQKNQMRDVHLFIQDICDTEEMERIMQQYRPNIIYHAAAYKHVPMMEENVKSAIKVNVGGTKSLADMAVKYGAKKFVMVSTDKAVNPTNVMGASKRIAEMYVQSLNFHQETTKFVTTRFGNVLGSNGSVIPIFRQQIENGGPVTVTHEEITRYFMTIPEACQLVITAGAMGKGGEIYIFDMGDSVKISDLAKKMIQLSGLQLGKDITIEYTGLRPGEKLYEELLANEENTTQTTHKKIMVAKVRTCTYSEILPDIEKLIEMRNDDRYNIVAQMKKIVPEFISKNSEFESIDHTNNRA